MRLWNELKRRRVFRVAGAYVIVTWLLVQVADIFFPALKLPEWSVTLVAGLVILGFPIAILLAWAYQVTPEGLVRTTEADSGEMALPPPGNRINYIIVGLLIVVVALLVFDRFLDGSPTSREAEPSVSLAGPGSLAGVIPLADDAPLASGIAAIGFDSPLIALSPDDRWLVYVGRSDDGSLLYLHDLGTFDVPTRIQGSEGAINAFFSPDGDWIGFITDDRVKRVSLDGREVQNIAAVTAPVEGIWLDNDTIFVIGGQGASVYRIEVGSGQAERLVYSSAHRFSDVLSNGKTALGVQFPASIDGDQCFIVAISLADGSAKHLGVRGYDAHDLGNGHLLFSRNGNLQVIAFDAAKLELSGQARTVLDGVALDSIFYQAQTAISKNGTLAFIPGSDSGVGRIVRQERLGNPEIVTSQALKYGVFDLSHDDSMLAIHVGDVTDYVQMFNLQTQQGRKLPGSEDYGWPIVSRTGKIAVSGLDQASQTVIRLGDVDRLTNEQDMTFTGLRGYPMDFSLDQDTLAFTEWENGGRIGRLPVSTDPAVEWIDGAAGDWGAVYSPDGDWFAYASTQTGRYEIWLRRADGSGTPRQISANGGIEPVWCKCGRVYYRRGDEIWLSAVTTGERPEIGQETLAFTMADFLDTPGRSFDVSSDGQTVYYVQLAQPAIGDRIHVISGFTASVTATSANR